MLPLLWQTAHAHYPRLRLLEDYIPPDPRQPVVVAWRSNLFRICPGLLSRPVSVVEDLRVLADVLDPTLVTHYGYGLSDVVELVLQRVDHVVATLSSVWEMEAEIPTLGDAPWITESELAQGLALSDFNVQVAECKYPEQAKRAVHDLSLLPKQLQRNPTRPCLAIRRINPEGTQLSLLPVAFLMNALPLISSHLSDRAFQKQPHLERVWQETVARVVYNIMNARPPTERSVCLSPETLPVPRASIRIDRGRRLHVQSVTSLRPKNLRRVWRKHRNFSIRGLPHFQASHPTHAFLTILACPSLPLDLDGSLPLCVSLQDLRSMVRDYDTSQEDIWYYVCARRELASSVPVFVADEIDLWECWYERKGFLSAGLPFTSLYVAPAYDDEEWLRAAGRSSAEMTLHQIGLPQTSWWAKCVVEDNTIMLFNGGEWTTCQIIEGPQTIALAAKLEHVSRESAEFLANLINGLTYKLQHLDIHSLQARRSATLIELQMHECSGFRIEHRPVESHERILFIGNRDSLMGMRPAEFERQLCHAVGKALYGEDCPQAFQEAWHRLRSCVRFDYVDVPHNYHEREPIVVHEAHRHSLERQRNAYLYDVGQAPGEYRGKDLSSLHTRLLAPWLLKQLTQATRAHRRTLLPFALEQYELWLSKRFRHEQRTALHQGFGDVSARTESAQLQQSQTILQAIRGIDFIVQLLIADDACGPNHPTPYSWQTVLSQSQAYLEVCLHSDEAHLGLNSVEISLSGTYDILPIATTASPTQVDINSYVKERWRETVPPAVPIEDKSKGREGPEQHGAAESFLAEWSAVSGAIDSIYGFRLEDLLDVLVIIGDQDAGDHGVCITTIPELAFVVFRQVIQPKANSEYYQKAISWLTLGSTTSAREPWKTEQQLERLCLKPIVAWQDESVFVLPWAAQHTLRVMMAYMQDGRLPWINEHSVNLNSDDLPIFKALRALRQERDKALERDCVAVMRKLAMTVYPAVTPRKAEGLGVTALTGEIDCLGVDSSTQTIWVVEAKNPQVPFSVRTIKQRLDKFHQPNGYIDKLQQKVQAVRRSSYPLLHSIGIDAKDSWQVKGLFVTRTPVPASYVESTALPFCTLDSLSETLRP